MDWFFNSFADLARVILVGTCAYIGVIVLLRAAGKRTLSKMNAFDLVVTVAIGSILASVLLSKDVALAEGLVAFATLIVLQYVIAWLSVRSPWVRNMVKSEPALLFYDGNYLTQSMKKERVTKEEIWSAVRAQGLASMAEVGGVVLETDGSFTVFAPTDQPATALQEVLHFSPDDPDQTFSS